jgi:hypothetical protein
MPESSTKQSKDNPFSRKHEREIREALKETYASGFLNPKREGCPTPKLKRSSSRNVSRTRGCLSRHHCSPCSQELSELIRQHKSQQRLYRAAAVSLIVVGLAAWALWASLRNRGTHVAQPSPVVKTPPEPASPPPTTQEPSGQEPRLPEVQVVVLDLRKRGISRGVDSSHDGDLSLPKGRLKLSIYLPFGSDEGNYEVRVSGRLDQVVTAKGRAAMKNRINVLTVELDLRVFDAGRYSLAIREAGWDWYRYPLQVK